MTTRITVLSATTTGFAWDFSGFDIEPSGVARPMRIASTNSTKQTLFSGFNSIIPSAQFTPETNHADNFAALANEQRADQLTVAQRATAYDALLRIENPSRHSPDTIDCISCHFSIHADVFVAQQHFSMTPSGNPNRYLPTSLALRSLATPTFDNSAGFNVHAFSYFGLKPGINQRAVNETAAVVEYLNANR